MTTARGLNVDLVYSLEVTFELNQFLVAFFTSKLSMFYIRSSTINIERPINNIPAYAGLLLRQK